MTDPIDQLERQLTDAAARRQTARAARRRPSRGLMVALAALVVSGSAAAAVVSRGGEPSKPLSGAIGSGEPGRSYFVSVSPDLRAGNAGWCTSVSITRRSHAVVTGVGCGSAHAAGDRLIEGGGLYGRVTIAYAVVTRDVDAVRSGRRTIATRADPALPDGWRYAVSVGRGTTTPTTPVPAAPVTARAHRRGQVARPLPARARRLLGPAPMIPVDAAGRALPTELPADRHSRAGRSRRVTRADPARRCVIGLAPGFVAGYRRVAVSWPRVPRRTEGPAFASCANTVFHPRGGRGGIDVGILLDARHPSARAPELPRSPVLTARRLGRGWLMAVGATAAERERLLTALHPRL